MADQKAPSFVFKSANNNVVNWPCKIAKPKDGGGTEDLDLVARFKVLSQDAYAAFYPGNEALLRILGAPAKADADPSGPAKPMGDVALLREVIVDFPGASVAQGQADFAAMLEEALSLPYVVAGLARGYAEMSAGGRVAKN